MTYPSPETVEDMLEVYTLSLYRLDTRGHRLYDQRSILVTTKTLQRLTGDVEGLVEEIHRRDPGREYFFEITPASELYKSRKPQVPHDSAVVAVTRPLVLARRSLRTGLVLHDVDMQFCPHTSSPLSWFITTEL